MKMIYVLLATALTVCGQQTPQQNQSLTGVELKGKVPVNRSPLKVNLAKPQEAKLSNGLRVLLIENHKAPSFTMQLVVLTGGLVDAPGKSGQALMTAALLREGTASLTSREISERIDALGSTLAANSSTSAATSTVTSSGLIENFDRTLDIFADVVRNPKFTPPELETLKSRLLAQLQVANSQPSFMAQSQLGRAIYGEHPAASPLPPEAAIKGLTSDDLVQFHGAYYRPNNAFLAVLGDVTMKQLLPKIERAFAGWQQRDVSLVAIPQPKPPEKMHIILVNRPGSVQTSLLLGHLSVERTNPDYFPLLVMNHILGGDPAARLFLNLRESKGYTYGASSNFSAYKYPGLLTAGADVRTEVTEGALKEFFYEIKRINDEEVTATELENAKRGLVGSFATSLDSPTAQLVNLIQLQVYGLAPDYWDVYPQRIAEVSAADVQRVAQKYLNPSEVQIVAVGDAAKVRAALEKYGTVEVL